MDKRPRHLQTKIVKVKRYDWKPDTRNQRVQELPDDVKLIKGNAVLVDENDVAVASQIVAYTGAGFIGQPDKEALKNRQEEYKARRLTYVGRWLHDEYKNWDDDTEAKGSGSSRLSGMLYPNQTFGTIAPSPVRRRMWCSTSQFDVKHARIAGLLRGMAAHAWEIAQETLPELAQDTIDAVYPKIHDDWLLAEAPWTSGIINKTAALPYHRDSNNIKGAISSMWVLRRHITGGYLHLPEYNVAFECPNKSLITFDGQASWHGVTPFHNTGRIQDKRFKDGGGYNPKDAYRMSMVYYARSMCQDCGPAHAEAKRAQVDRTEKYEVTRTEMLLKNENGSPTKAEAHASKITEQ